MAEVALSLGSNSDPSLNLRQAVAALTQQFGPLALSPVFESEAVGFDGDNFLNLVAVIETDQSPGELAQTLKTLENAQGRDRSAPRFSGRTLDVDILTYDALIGVHEGIELPRAEITCNAFVLWPLAEVLPDALHPVTGKTYSQLWREFDRSRQRLWQVPFDWQGQAGTLTG